MQKERSSMDECWTTMEQGYLADRLYAEGEDPEAWRCRRCGMIYDGGQCCTHCGDHNPLNDPEEEFEF